MEGNWLDMEWRGGEQNNGDQEVAEPPGKIMPSVATRLAMPTLA